jgi:hypothetical protein
MLITGFAQWSIPMNVHKTCGVWFPKEQLGMANGVVSVGNWLAKFGPGLPFLFWAALVFLGFVAYFFLRQPAIGSTSSSQT